MNSEAYLQSYGWQKGEPLKKGGLKKPILVKHKKDTRGLGHDKNEHDAWWERVFDGQLKGLDVTGSGGDMSFTQTKVSVRPVNEYISPLYRMFVKGGVLEGSIEKLEINKPSEERSEKKKKSKKDKSGKKKSKKDKAEDVEGGSKKRKRSSKEEKRRKKIRSDEEDWIRQLVSVHTTKVTA